MTRREHVPIDYDPKLDRRQAEPLGCVRILFVLVIFIVLVFLIVTGIAAATRKPNDVEAVPTVASLPTSTETPTETPTLEASATPTATATLDDWSATGTALAMATISPTPTASATLDYCWWLTPTVTPTATLAFTPDAWQATGTAIYEATNPYMTPTPPPPRELCIEYASLLVLPTEEATSELIVITMTPGPETTVTINGPLYTPAVALPQGADERPAATQPRSNVTITGGRTEQVVVTSEPQVIVHTAPPPAPQVIIQTQVIIATNPPPAATVTRNADYYASATSYFGTVGPIWTETASYVLTMFAPTTTPSATATNDAVIHPEPTQEVTATIEPSATYTETPSPTPSSTVTETPTLEPTMTETPSPTPTATDVPTEPALEEATDA